MTVVGYYKWWLENFSSRNSFSQYTYSLKKKTCACRYLDTPSTHWQDCKNRPGQLPPRVIHLEASRLPTISNTLSFRHAFQKKNRPAYRYMLQCRRDQAREFHCDLCVTDLYNCIVGRRRIMRNDHMHTNMCKVECRTCDHANSDYKFTAWIKNSDICGSWSAELGR
jgi:hypothetical protein